MEDGEKRLLRVGSVELKARRRTEPSEVQRDLSKLSQAWGGLGTAILATPPGKALVWMTDRLNTLLIRLSRRGPR